MAEQRLIDANALLDAMRNEEFQTFVPLDEIDSVIDKAPTIDAVPVVRCRECKHRGKELECPMCNVDKDARGEWVIHDKTRNNGFCNKGEKMDGGATDGSDA